MNTGKRRISFFTVGVLIVIVGALFGIWDGNENPLFDEGASQTLYASAKVGEPPELHAEDYFEEGVLEADRLTYDMENCDLNTPGIYTIPVLYDGKETNCVFELTVEESLSEENAFSIPELPDSQELSVEIRISE